MIDHLSLGVRDLARSRAFYDAALGALGYERLYEDAGSLGYGAGSVALWVLAVERPVTPDLASGVHVSFVAKSRAQVARFHAAALDAGGRDNGAPGLRADYGAGYYAAYAIDPDGYRLEAHCDEGST